MQEIQLSTIQRWKSIGTWEPSSQKFFWISTFTENFTENFWGLIINCKNNSVTLAIGSIFLQRISQKLLKSDN